MQRYKNLVLPLAMVIGAVFHEWMGYLTFLSPYLIFAMLFITYCKLKPHDFKPERMQMVLLTVQMLMAGAVYGLLTWWNHTLAEGVFICVFIPTATAAPVITAMLGGSISRVATFSLVSNIFVALVGPVVLAAVGDHAEYTFMQSFLIILREVFPLLLLPLAVAFGLRYLAPKVHNRIVGLQQLSFYLWAVSLVIVVGSCVSFAISHWTPANTWTMVMLAAGALAVCLAQFKVGRMVGARYGDKVSGGQGLGQKNTVLAVWLALAYMHPIASIAPAAYIAWQNILNSWQLVRYSKAQKI